MAKPIERPEVTDDRFVEGTEVSIEGTEFRFCHLKNRDVEMDGNWNCEIKIEKASALAMKKIGFGIKEDDADGTFWLKAKAIYKTRAGDTKDAPPVLMKESSEPVTVEPGNGTTGDIDLWCKYTPPIKGKIYMGCYINKVKIDKLEVWESDKEKVKF